MYTILKFTFEFLFPLFNVDRRAHALSEGHAVPEFSVSVVFVEIYNDDVIDLLSHRKNNSDAQPSMKRTNTGGWLNIICLIFIPFVA